MQNRREAVAFGEGHWENYDRVIHLLVLLNHIELSSIIRMLFIFYLVSVHHVKASLFNKLVQISHWDRILFFALV